VALSGDRYIVRKFSPVITIGGGTILDPSPLRRRRKEALEDLDVLEQGALPERIAVKVKKSGIKGMKALSLSGWIKAETPSIDESLSLLKKQGILKQLGETLLHRDIYTALEKGITETLYSFHKKNPLSPGMLKEELRAQLKMSPEVWNTLLSSLEAVIVDKDVVRMKDVIVASSVASQSSEKILQLLERARFQPPSKEELSETLKMDAKALGDLLKLMSKEGSVVRINDSLYVAGTAFKEMISLLRGFFAKKPAMTVAEFRDILDTTRKYALPFLEYLDSNKITLRVGDVRKFLLK
jgi:selenocysteine-specific elongation factor